MHRKRWRRYHATGDLHELTFSCYRRLPWLTNNAWRRELAQAIDQAGAKDHMPLVGGVAMLTWKGGTQLAGRVVTPQLLPVHPGYPVDGYNRDGLFVQRLGTGKQVF